VTGLSDFYTYASTPPLGKSRVIIMVIMMVVAVTGVETRDMIVIWTTLKFPVVSRVMREGA